MFDNNLYKKASFLLSAPELAALPADQGIEVAFAGRSNVGKSSVLNTLTHNSKLARTSKTPGRTQAINLFTLDDVRRLADLPGYGYAKVAKSLRASWGRTLADYLYQRECLHGLVLIMDIRHPLKPMDCLLLDWAVSQQRALHVVLSKADKLSNNQVKQTCFKVEKHLADAGVIASLQAFSSLKRQGAEQLCAVLNEWFALDDDDEASDTQTL